MVIIDSNVEVAVADFTSAIKGNIPASTVTDMLTRRFSRKKYQTFAQTLAELRAYDKAVRHVRVWLELIFFPDGDWTMEQVHDTIREEGGIYADYISFGLTGLEVRTKDMTLPKEEIMEYLANIQVYIRYLMGDVMYNTIAFNF